MIRKAFIAALAIAIMTPSAALAKVSSDTTPGVNFQSYKTFYFVNSRPPTGMDPVAFERIRMAIERGLTSKGYTNASGGDMAIIITIGAKDKTDIDTWGAFGRQVDVRQYTEGSLSVDAFDAKTARPLWHGRAIDNVGSKLNPVKAEKEVGKLMAEFPSR
ncbi:DUF4136 domain-containing protein [Novosphingobium panipatense]|uniref:DUF4136 domain-containing protein n=1 Tax=Novosphingobium panipatense TaxID=428991 RepID=A0ABY1Q054_9SPHN|nr:DUF4136 domain-containing protein [Novosphingobium panipatense]SMP54631.1 protein of unknown function [Novosphingobium panipatense]